MDEQKLAAALRQARNHEAAHEIERAREMYEAILALRPAQTEAQRGLQALREGVCNASARAAPAAGTLRAIVKRCQQGDFAPVAGMALNLVKLYPSSSELWNIRGVATLALDRLADAEEGFRRAAALSPHDPEIQFNLGNVLYWRNDLAAALESFRKASELDPGYCQAHLNAGAVLQLQGHRHEARQAYERAIDINPDDANAHYNLGNLHRDMGQDDDAIASYQSATALDQTFSAAHFNLGNIFRNRSEYEKAIPAYRNAVRAAPDSPGIWKNLGVTLQDTGCIAEAMDALRTAVRLKPDDPGALLNLANALQEQGALDDAIACYGEALSLAPERPALHHGLGLAHFRRGDLEAAVAALRSALTHDPANEAAWAQLHHIRFQLGDWREAETIRARCQRLGLTGDAVPPFFLLAMEDDPARQLLRSRNFAQTELRAGPLPVKPASDPRRERLRVGYFSSDFADHAVMHLMSGLLREHDKASFEIILYSYGRRRFGAMHDHAVAQADRFFDIADVSHPDAAARARAQDLDIAIDVNGYTADSRSRLFGYRMAPVQINYLGYPGTMGSDFHDYIVADPTVIPEEFRHHYSESVIFLPDSYQPNDNERGPAAPAPTRMACGLPEDGFVFCCFNNSYKISPREFDIWMRLLREIDGSVLWLLASHPRFEENMRAEARKRKVDPDRLVFAPKVAQADHLARHVHADLVLDTFNYNAHTTASDALWMGVPIVTRAGQQFAARVGASLLRSVGLPELITQSDAEYFEVCLDLARRPDTVAQIKGRLQSSLASAPLFDTRRYTRGFEAGLRLACAQSRAGRRGDIRVTQDML